MKNLFFACALVAGTAFTASAQTPMGTPPPSTTSPASSTSAPKPDATIETQANTGFIQTNPADKPTMRSNRAMKRKNGKTKMKSQPASTM
ncbi:hypothetical protein [Hymenobacter cheonanensis]|uniref:hypothetical protein n=1 Tax=Hymenobacter sp. CA2-7 TaxID=3063993 RepID=UPI002713AA45|nr:hypothetical protein [Hymenobacter sp. CA2-7]MDO7886456.1 hypothetical protein [Hymenobacter sp. CA2-7]